MVFRSISLRPLSQPKYALDLLTIWKIVSQLSLPRPLEWTSIPTLILLLWMLLITGLSLAACRPDICFAVSLLSRLMQAPRACHLQAAKRILRYIKGTINLGIHYSSEVPRRSIRKGFLVIVALTDPEVGEVVPIL